MSSLLATSLHRFVPDWRVSRNLSTEQYKQKQERILHCLQGCDPQSKQELDISSPTIDLWELREMALSPGGLLDASLRKRAWPILTACHMALLENDANSKPSVPPSQSDLQTLRHDVKRTVWDITEYLQSKAAFSRMSRSMEDSLNESRQSSRRVSFAMDMKGRSDKTTGNGNGEDLSIPPIQMTHTDTSEDEIKFENDHETTVVTTSYNECSMVSDVSTSFLSSGTMNSSGRRVRWRKASKYEQKVVANVVTSILRMPAPEHACYTDDRFHYFSGLHNLTALLLANLESPSLTSLVLGKLAVFHLRDAMRQGTVVAENALRLTLFPLLQQVDPVLYHHICVRSGLKESGFALSWVTAWFASDAGDMAVASRLVDVFLVSHPLMPVYCVVALLVSQRRRLLRCDASIKSIYANLRSLNLMASLTMSGEQTSFETAMNQTEEIIASALVYIKRTPPKSLIQLSVRGPTCNSNHLSAITMLSATEPPAWCTSDSCPTEWEVLSRAKAMRTGQIHVEVQRHSSRSKNVKRYKRALAAAAHKPSERNSGVFRVFFCCATLALVTYTLLSFSFIWKGMASAVVTSSDLGSSALPIETQATPKSFPNGEMPIFYSNSSFLDGDFKNSSVGNSTEALGLVPFRFSIAFTEMSVDRYPLSVTEQEFDRHILKPFHSLCGKLLNKARNSILTVVRKVNPQRNTVLVSYTFDHDQLYSYPETKTDTCMNGSEDYRLTCNVTENGLLLPYDLGTSMVVSSNQGATSSNQNNMRKLRRKVKQTMELLKRGMQKGKIGLTALRFALKVTSSKIGPFLNDSVMQGLY